MRRAGKVDGNHDAIASALKAAGYSVVSLAGLGNGVPDLLIGCERANVLLELKDPTQPPNKRRLNSLQKRWHAEWQGTAHLVETAEQALAVCAFYKGRVR